MLNIFHPIFVHFPIALLIVAGVVALIDLLKGNYQLKKVVMWNLIFAAIGTIITVITGLIDANAIPENHTICEIILAHEYYGIVFLIVIFVISIWMIKRISKMNKTENIFFVLSLWIVIAIAGYITYLGGKMVYNNGVGVKPMQKSFPSDDHECYDFIEMKGLI